MFIVIVVGIFSFSSGVKAAVIKNNTCDFSPVTLTMLTATDEGLDALTCKNENVTKFIKLLSICFMIVKIVVPLILIITGIISMFNAFVADDQSAMSKALSNFVIKLVIGVAIFFLPTILSAMIGLINGSDDVKDEYSVCSKCLLDYCSCPGVHCKNSKPHNGKAPKVTDNTTNIDFEY